MRSAPLDFYYGTAVDVIEDKVNFLVDGSPHPYSGIPMGGFDINIGDRGFLCVNEKNKQVPILMGFGKRKKYTGKKPDTKVSKWIQFHQDAEFGRKVPYEISGITPDNLKIKWTMTLEAPP
jgi:hypothetical protein